MHKDYFLDLAGWIINFDNFEIKYYGSLLFDNKKFPSSWTSYPEKYKFISIDIFANNERTYIKRKTYTLFDLFGDVGGVLATLIIVISWIMRSFASFNLNVFMSNRLYTWDEPFNY